jgi:hypothetical protein
VLSPCVYVLHILRFKPLKNFKEIGMNIMLLGGHVNVTLHNLLQSVITKWKTSKLAICELHYSHCNCEISRCVVTDLGNIFNLFFGDFLNSVK